MEFFPIWDFDMAVKEYRGDFHAKNLDNYSHCFHPMFGLIAGCKYTKDIALPLRALNKVVWCTRSRTSHSPSGMEDFRD